jgi:hypothetical protein
MAFSGHVDWGGGEGDALREFDGVNGVCQTTGVAVWTSLVDVDWSCRNDLLRLLMRMSRL